MYFIIKTLRIKTNEKFKTSPYLNEHCAFVMSAVLPIARDRHLRRNTQILPQQVDCFFYNVQNS